MGSPSAIPSTNRARRFPFSHVLANTGTADVYHMGTPQYLTVFVLTLFSLLINLEVSWISSSVNSPLVSYSHALSFFY